MKALTDVVVSWLKAHGYSELTVEVFGGPAGRPGEYRVTVKSAVDS